MKFRHMLSGLFFLTILAVGTYFVFLAEEVSSNAIPPSNQQESCRCKKLSDVGHNFRNCIATNPPDIPDPICSVDVCEMVNGKATWTPQIGHYAVEVQVECYNSDNPDDPNDDENCGHRCPITVNGGGP